MSLPLDIVLAHKLSAKVADGLSVTLLCSKKGAALNVVSFSFAGLL